jgi:hypothetical protein
MSSTFDHKPNSTDVNSNPNTHLSVKVSRPQPITITCHFINFVTSSCISYRYSIMKVIQLNSSNGMNWKFSKRFLAMKWYIPVSKLSKKKRLYRLSKYFIILEKRYHILYKNKNVIFVFNYFWESIFLSVLSKRINQTMKR